MNRNKIKITVAGLPASGKSKMLYIIKHMLKEEGFNIKHNVNIDFNNESQFDKQMENNIEKVFEHFKKTKSISIEETTLKLKEI